MTEITYTGGLGITAVNLAPSHFQFFDGDKIIKIGRDCSLELGTGWVDHNDAATEFFNVVVGRVMPRWKQQERMEERAAIVAWLRSDKIVLSMDGSKEDVIASAIEAGEHLK